MSPTNTSNEEIIERSERSPVATSCLVIAALALLGAIVIQVAEIAQYRGGALKYAKKSTPGMLTAQADVREFKKDVEEIITGAGESATVDTEMEAEDVEGTEGEEEEDFEEDEEEEDFEEDEEEEDDEEDEEEEDFEEDEEGA